MNRKTFLILLALLVVLGGAGLALFWQDLSAWRSTDAKIGSKLFDKLAVNTIAQIRIVDGKGEVTLAIKDKRWVVSQRGDYSANVQDIGDLLVKLPDLKVVQTENVGAALLPRLDLMQPGKDAKSADSAGTLLELSDQGGKVVASLLLGKKVIKTEDSPLPIKPQTAVGRYVLSPGSQNVLVVSDALNSAEAKPERWLAKDFFKAERIKMLSVSGDGAQWKIARNEEFGQWKFADGAGPLDASAAVAAVNSLASLAFADVAPDVKSAGFDKTRTITAETFDRLTYTLKLGRKPATEDYYLTVEIAGEPARERKPEKGEKADDKARLDKQFAEDLKKLDERIKIEKSLAMWTYVVAGKTLQPLLKDRAQLSAGPSKPPVPGR
jgi:Domain of unknown function (DUF4340)